MSALVSDTVTMTLRCNQIHPSKDCTTLHPLTVNLPEDTFRYIPQPSYPQTIIWSQRPCRHTLRPLYSLRDQHPYALAYAPQCAQNRHHADIVMRPCFICVKGKLPLYGHPDQRHRACALGIVRSDYHRLPGKQSWSSEWSPIQSHECRHKHQAYNRKASQSCPAYGKSTAIFKYSNIQILKYANIQI